MQVRFGPLPGRTQPPEGATTDDAADDPPPTVVPTTAATNAMIANRLIEGHLARPITSPFVDTTAREPVAPDEVAPPDAAEARNSVDEAGSRRSRKYSSPRRSTARGLRRERPLAARLVRTPKAQCARQESNLRTRLKPLFPHRERGSSAGAIQSGSVLLAPDRKTPRRRADALPARLTAGPELEREVEADSMVEPPGQRRLRRQGEALDRASPCTVSADQWSSSSSHPPSGLSSFGSVRRFIGFAVPSQRWLASEIIVRIP